MGDLIIAPAGLVTPQEHLSALSTLIGLLQNRPGRRLQSLDDQERLFRSRRTGGGP